MRVHYLLSISLVFLLVKITVGQSVEGPTPVYVGETKEYTFNNGTIYNSNSVTWGTSSLGSFSKLPNIGAQHRANITWNSPGTATVSFLVNYSQVGSSLTVVVGIGTPNTTFTTTQGCGSTTVQRNTNPPGGVNWYWQTSASGTSTSLGSASSISVTTSQTLYLRARWGTTGAWSSSSQLVGTVTVIAPPSAPSTSTDGHAITSSSAVVPLSVGSVSGATGYKWYEQSSGGTAVVTTSLPNYSPDISISKTFWVSSLKGTCESTTRRSVQAYIHPAPILSASGGGVVRMGSPVTLSAANYSYDSYVWLHETGQSIPGGTSASYNTTSAGVYKLMVTKGTSATFTTPIGIQVNSVYSQNENYVITNTILTSNITLETQLAGLSVESMNQSIDYFDGLGRPLQKVISQGSPLKQDVVQPFLYDEYGRVNKSFLPVVLNENSGMLKNSIVDPVLGYVGNAAQFYALNSNNQIVDDDRPFSTVSYEESPLERVLKTYGPGKSWFDNSKFLEAKELVNVHGSAAGQERIILWTVNSSGVPHRNGYYANGSLAVKAHKDEDGNRVRLYENRLGQLILRKVFLSGDTTQLDNHLGWTQTYYIYDDLGQLRWVLQPELVKVLAASGSINPDSTQLARHSFLYKYDGRQRLIVKRMPGADSVIMVYDRRDRLVFSQDGNQRHTSPKEWTAIKYDDRNRPVIVSKYVSNDSRMALQGQVDSFYASMNSSKSWFETYIGSQAGNVGGYDNKSFPSFVDANNFMVLNYYDQYDTFIAPAGYTYTSDGLPGQESTNAAIVAGLPTATRTKNLQDGTWLRTIFYYDGKYRGIQTITDHQKGTIRASNIYDFAGRVLTTKRTYVVNSVTTSIKETINYDHGNRVVLMKHSINGAADVTVMQNSFNELGQLVDKKLHSTDGVNFKQSVDYTYNIRGITSKINEPDVSTIAPGDNIYDYFGMELLFNSSITGLGNTALYNGNISAIQWSKGYGGASNKQAYVFQYDRMNQLVSSAHKASVSAGVWSANNGAFDESLSYDFNGNINKLLRRGAGGVIIDSLRYGYSGNQLTHVHDSGNAFMGFVNENTGADDYGYDRNGNLTTDRNKGIAAGGIRYNFLNLVNEVVKGTQSVRYIHDASGRKLAQEEYNGTTLQKRTDYIGELIFENDILQLIQMGEGRVIKDGANWEYQYHLKDHLGNIRVTFTTKPQSTTTLTASFETGTQSSEQANFNNYSSITYDLVDHTDAAGTTYSKVQLLNGGVNGRVGLARSLSVMPGDEITISAWAKYMNLGTSPNATPLINSLAAAFGVSSGSTGDQLRLYNGLNSYAVTVPSGDHQNDNESAPKAFVTILFFDRDYNLIDAAWDQMTTIGAQTSATTKQPPHDQLAVTARAKEAGYAYVFISNEHPTFVDVYFDDVSLSFTASPIVSVNDYYPFGLQYNSGNRENGIRQNFLFNGKELQDELSLNWYDYGARMYMSDIGRWNAIDPMADAFRRWSPYNYCVNSPVRMIDPDGMQTLYNEAAQEWFKGHLREREEKKTAIATMFKSAAKKSLDNAANYMDTAFANAMESGSLENASAAPASAGPAEDAQQTGTGYLFQNAAFFDDINYGVNAMWQASFNGDGSVYREHMAYVVPNGLIVLPNINNTSNTSDPNALPLHDVGDGAGHTTRFVEFQGQRMQILAVFHTHPNGNPYPSPGADYQFARLGIPSYVISDGQIREAYLKQSGNEASRKVGDRNMMYPY